MMTSNRVIGDMEHPKEEPQILDIIRIVIIVNGEPINSMSPGIFIPYNSTIHPARDQNGTLEGRTRMLLANEARQVRERVHLLLCRSHPWQVVEQALHTLAETHVMISAMTDSASVSVDLS